MKTSLLNKFHEVSIFSVNRLAEANYPQVENEVKSLINKAFTEIHEQLESPIDKIKLEAILVQVFYAVNLVADFNIENRIEEAKFLIDKAFES